MIKSRLSTEVITLAINKENKERISISLKHESLRILRQTAEENCRTVSGEIENLIQKHLVKKNDN